jgi:hypothetical protein
MLENLQDAINLAATNCSFKKEQFWSGGEF